MAAKRRAKDEGGIYEREVSRWAGQYVVETHTEAKRYYVYAKTRKEAVECSLGKIAQGSSPRPALLKGLLPDMVLTSFSPTSGYPSLDLDRYVYLVRAVENRLHPFDHRLLQPSLCVRRLLCITLNDHLVVADEYRYGPRALVPTLSQKR